MSNKNNNKKLTPSELSVFCYQFSVVFKAGLPYLEGLQLLADDVFDKNLKGIANEVVKSAEEGILLNEAIKKQGVFPEYMVSMLSIAESTGRLGDVFEQLSVYYDHQDQLKQKIKNALTYPFVLIGLMTAVLLMLILKVLPIFHEILLSVGGSVPTATKFVLDLSQVIQSVLLVFIGLVAVGALYLLLVFKTSLLKSQRDYMLLNAPIVRKIYKKMILVKFARALSILIRSGLPVQSSLEMIQPMMDNHLIQSKIKLAISDVEKGESLESALRKTKLFPELFIKMLSLGNKTGDLDTTLEKISNIYDQELNRTLHRVTVSIEPTLVIILSLVVGAILLLVMLPLINIMSSIG